MSHLLCFFSGAAALVLVFAWHNRLTYARPRTPNQWKRYKGVQNLRDTVTEPLPLSTAHLVLDLRRKQHAAPTINTRE